MFVTLSIKPIDGGSGHPRRFAVILRDGHMVSDEDEVQQFASARLGSAEDEHVRRLEEELRITRARLQATIEELESTNEELKASNEEYRSVNDNAHRHAHRRSSTKRFPGPNPPATSGSDAVEPAGRVLSRADARDLKIGEGAAAAGATPPAPVRG